MTKEDKAKEYASKRYGCNKSQYQMAKAQACAVGYMAGWDEALKSLWINVEERLPELYKIVLVLYEYEENNYQIQEDSREITDTKDNWYFGRCKIIAWMPIPSFDDIIKANKDVLKRLKDK